MSEASNRRQSNALTIAGIITLAAALGFVGLFTVIPAIYSFILSFKDYEVFKGLLNSAWVGLDNYAKVFQSDQFWPIAGWTVRYSACSAAALFTMSLLTGCLLMAIQTRWLRHALCTVLLLPLIVPGELWASAFLGIFSVTGTSSIWLLSLWGAVKYIGLPALLVTASLSHGRRAFTVPVLSAGAASLALFALLGRPDFTLLKALHNPLNNIQILDDYVFRTALMQMKFSTAVISQISVSAMRCLLLAAVAWPVAAMLRRLFPAATSPTPALPRDRFISLAAAGAVAIAALATLGTVTLTLGSGGSSNNQELQMLPGILIHTALALFTAFANTLLCFLLARPAACGGKAGRKVMLAVLILLTAMSMTAYSIGEYLIFRPLGLFNTLFAMALSGIGTVWGVWPLLFAAKGLGVGSNADWFKRMWKPALALFAVQAAMQANNSMPSLVYSSQTVYQHPLNLLQSLMFYRTGEINATVGVGLLAVMMLAVPVALILIIRTVLSEKENLALFIPGK